MTVLIAIARRSGIEAVLRAYDGGMTTPVLILPGHAHTPAQPQPIPGQYLVRPYVPTTG